MNSAVADMIKDTAGLGIGLRADLLGEMGKNLGVSEVVGLAKGLSAADLGLSATGGLSGFFNDEATRDIALTGLTAKGLSAADLGLSATGGLADFFKDTTTRDIAIKSLAGFSDVGDLKGITDFASGLTGVMDGLFGEDIARSRSLAAKQLAATSGIADFIGSDRMVSSWRQSLLSEATARSLLGTTALGESHTELLRDIVGINSATARIVGRYADHNLSGLLAPARSARPTRELRGFLTAMPVAPAERDMTFGVTASRAVAGITAADLYLSPGSVDSESGDLLEAEVVEPWVSGPQAHRESLMQRLADLDETIPELLRAAWDQVESKGPAAVSLAAHAVVEVVDRTLHAAAPNDAVLEWHASAGGPKDLVFERDGKLVPTRSGRITFALHQRRPEEAKVIKALAQALSAEVALTQKALQAGKHGSKGTVALVRAHLVSVEATLTQLLFDPTEE